MQVTDQSTPAVPTSFVTFAVKLAAVPAVTPVGIGEANAIEIAGTTVIVATAVLVGSAVDVAVTVTVPPDGTADGATNVAGDPLAVCDVTVPQAPALAQLSVQSTPRFALSYCTVAIKLACPLTCTEAATGATDTAIGGGGSIVSSTVAETLGFAVDVAVKDTVPPAGILAGGV